MTLVLFDEADSLLDADKGFLAALPGLIRDSRRPIVLCLNDSRLPAGLSGSAVGLQVQQVRVKPSDVSLLGAVCSCVRLVSSPEALVHTDSYRLAWDLHLFPGCDAARLRKALMYYHTRAYVCFSTGTHTSCPCTPH